MCMYEKQVVSVGPSTMWPSSPSKVECPVTIDSLSSFRDFLGLVVLSIPCNIVQYWVHVDLCQAFPIFPRSSIENIGRPGYEATKCYREVKGLSCASQKSPWPIILLGRYMQKFDSINVRRHQQYLFYSTWKVLVVTPSTANLGEEIPICIKVSTLLSSFISVQLCFDMQQKLLRMIKHVL